MTLARRSSCSGTGAFEAAFQSCFSPGETVITVDGGKFGERWGMFGYARAERLIGDAGKSPIVRSLGSRNQLSGGLGLSYTFTVRR